MDQEKQKRSQNFTNNDRSLLINIVAKYKNIIENKKTDSVTVSEKNEIWKKIAQEFNSCGPSCPRNIENLKRCYENRKILLKKSAAFQRRQVYKTGGGKPEVFKKEDPDDELLLSIICTKNVHGLEDHFGGDALEEDVYQPDKQSSTEPQTMIHVIEDTNGNIEFVYEQDDGEMDTSVNLKEIRNEQTEHLISDSVDSSQQQKDNWKKYKSGDLKLPSSRELVHETPSMENISDKASSIMNVSRSRPRTIVKSLTSSEISKKYNILLDKRLEIAEYQKKQLRDSATHAALEHKLRVDLLKVQIKNETEESKM